MEQATQGPPQPLRPIAVLLEGVDKTGKTTLAEALVNQWTMDGLPNRYLHFGAPEAGEDPYDDYRAVMAEVQARITDPFPQMSWIIDRLHWSEYAYGTVYRGGADLARWHALDEALSFAGLVVILKERAAEDVDAALDEDYQQPGDSARLASIFHQLAVETRCPTVRVPFGEDVPDDFLSSAQTRYSIQRAKHRHPTGRKIAQ